MALPFEGESEDVRDAVGVSAIAAEIEQQRYDAPPEDASEDDLPIAAKVYLFTIVALAVVASLPLIGRLPDSHGWITFAVLATAAAVAQVFNVQNPHNQSYHTAIVFVSAAALLLPAELVVLVAVLQHIPEWLKVRYRWYMQTFNIANYVLSMLAAW